MRKDERQIRGDWFVAMSIVVDHAAVDVRIEVAMICAIDLLFFCKWIWRVRRRIIFAPN